MKPEEKARQRIDQLLEAAGWKELPTEILGENVTHVSYKASTGGFSVFAITVYALPAEAQPAGINIMLVGALVVVVILIAAFVVLRKRR